MCNLTNWLLAASLLTLPGCSDKDNPASPGEQKVLGLAQDPVEPFDSLLPAVLVVFRYQAA